MPSFSYSKELRFVITLGTGTFGASSSANNVVTMQGFRATVDIDKGGGMMFGTLRARIYGVSQSDMNSVTTLQYQALNDNPNTVSVYAIDGPQETLIFQGNIVNAWGDYQSMPDVYLQIQAQAAYFNQLKPVAPTSYPEAVDVAAVIGQLAGAMGYTFENNGVSVFLSKPYYSGTAIDQVRAAAGAAKIYWGIENNILWISPRGGARTGQIPEISPQSGMVGYPTYDGQGGIIIQTIFNPAIRFLGHIRLVTSIPKATGQWTVVGVAHRLESQKPGGAWFSTVRGNASGLVPTA